jgi:hypothetical protein
MWFEALQYQAKRHEEALASLIRGHNKLIDQMRED